MQLHRHEPELRAAGATLVIVGNGTPNFIAGFREKTGYRGPLYTDPDLKIYRELELRRDVTSTFNPRAIGRAISAFRGGHRQSRTQGDPWQQGGVFAVDSTGTVSYSYRSSHAGDHPEIADIVRALAAAGTAGPQ